MFSVANQPHATAVKFHYQVGEFADLHPELPILTQVDSQKNVREVRNATCTPLASADNVKLVSDKN